jgi:hypothetical protein
LKLIVLLASMFSFWPIHRYTDVHTDRYGETDGQAPVKQAVRQIDTQTERQTVTRTARQTDFKILASTVLCVEQYTVRQLFVQASWQAGG